MSIPSREELLVAALFKAALRSTPEGQRVRKDYLEAWLAQRLRGVSLADPEPPEKRAQRTEALVHVLSDEASKILGDDATVQQAREHAVDFLKQHPEALQIFDEANVANDVIEASLVALEKLATEELHKAGELARQFDAAVSGDDRPSNALERHWTNRSERAIEAFRFVQQIRADVTDAPGLRPALALALAGWASAYAARPGDAELRRAVTQRRSRHGGSVRRAKEWTLVASALRKRLPRIEGRPTLAALWNQLPVDDGSPGFPGLGVGGARLFRRAGAKGRLVLWLADADLLDEKPLGSFDAFEKRREIKELARLARRR